MLPKEYAIRMLEDGATLAVPDVKGHVSSRRRRERHLYTFLQTQVYTQVYMQAYRFVQSIKFP